MSLIVQEVEATDEALGQTRELIAQTEAHDGVSPVSDQAMLAVAQGQRALLFSQRTETRSSSGSEATPAALVAVAIVGQGEVDVVVAPEHRGAGIGSATLTHALQHPHATATELRAWAHGTNPAADSLLGSAGFTPVRTLLRMELDPTLLPAHTDPLAIPTPPDFALRTFDPGSAHDARAWVHTNAAAFADHPEQGRITEDDFALIRAEDWFDPADLIVLEHAHTQAQAGAGAEGAARFAGFTWIKTLRNATTESPECELYALGVLPEHAGKGLGRLLLDVTLARMAQHRPSRVTLYVDGENERAVELYRRASFTIGSSSRQWKRPGTPENDVRMYT